MPDGSIVFDTRIDNTQAAKDLQKLEKKIQETEKTIESLTAQKKEAQKTSAFSAAELDKEKASLMEIKDRLQEIRSLSRDKTLDVGTREAYKGMIPGVQTELQEQQARVNALQSEYNKVYDSVGRYDQKLQEANTSLENQKANAQMLTEEIQRSNSPIAKFGHRVREAGDDMGTLENRIKRLASRVFVFSMITAALRSFRTWMGKVIKTDSEATAAMAKLKGALLTMVQPLVNVIIPAFVTFVNLLTHIATTAAEIMSGLFGQTIEQSSEAAKGLYEETEALEATGDAAKDAEKSLASFYEINKLSGDKAGGGKADKPIAPDFTGIDNGLSEKLKDIADLVFLIGTGFALWKIGSALPGTLGTIATNLGLILLVIGSILIAWDGLSDAWENGVDWLNLIEMIGGVAGAAFALYKLLGPTAAGIALVVGGLAMLVTAFKDAFENGWTLQNTLLAIAGIMATGLGISLLTGNLIPLLVAGIASVLLAITVLTGHGGELIEGLKMIFEGFSKFITGVFTGDMDLAVEGILEIFSGIGVAFNAIVDGIKDAFNAFLDWLDEKTGGKLSPLIETIRSMFNGLVDAIEQIFGGLITFISGVFTGDWDRAWEGVKEIFKGVWNGIASIFESAINFILDGVNWLIAQLNKIHFELPDWVPGIGGKSFGINIPPVPKLDIPRLAKGEVIPPNNEFLAVLGDQKRGNNIEAPEDLIRQIVREEGGGNNAAILRQILAAIKEGKVMMVNQTVFAQLVSSSSDSEGFRLGDPMVTVH